LAFAIVASAAWLTSLSGVPSTLSTVFDRTVGNAFKPGNTGFEVSDAKLV